MQEEKESELISGKPYGNKEGVRLYFMRTVKASRDGTGGNDTCIFHNRFYSYWRRFNSEVVMFFKRGEVR